MYTQAYILSDIYKRRIG